MDKRVESQVHKHLPKSFRLNVLSNKFKSSRGRMTLAR